MRRSDGSDRPNLNQADILNTSCPVYTRHCGPVKPPKTRCTGLLTCGDEAHHHLMQVAPLSRTRVPQGSQGGRKEQQVWRVISLPRVYPPTHTPVPRFSATCNASVADSTASPTAAAAAGDTGPWNTASARPPRGLVPWTSPTPPSAASKATGLEASGRPELLFAQLGGPCVVKLMMDGWCHRTLTCARRVKNDV